MREWRRATASSRAATLASKITELEGAKATLEAEREALRRAADVDRAAARRPPNARRRRRRRSPPRRRAPRRRRLRRRPPRVPARVAPRRAGGGFARRRVAAPLGGDGAPGPRAAGFHPRPFLGVLFGRPPVRRERRRAERLGRGGGSPRGRGADDEGARSARGRRTERPVVARTDDPVGRARRRRRRGDGARARRPATCALPAGTAAVAAAAAGADPAGVVGGLFVYGGYDGEDETNDAHVLLRRAFDDEAAETKAAATGRRSGSGFASTARRARPRRRNGRTRRPSRRPRRSSGRPRPPRTPRTCG